ncbi:MAG: hypothetical protein HIU86_09725 [Acidobacteria bacterium]|nr:hypothetical protein [Acidobacteriota bacterium]
MQNTLCVCGHARDAHEHYRRGTDCATCGPEVCPKFRRSLRTRTQPPTPPVRPSSEGVDRDDASRRRSFVATGPLAIVSDLRARAARGLPTA